MATPDDRRDGRTGGGWLRHWYRFSYAIGATPWEMDTAEVAPQIDALVAGVEATRRPPYGAALDLGCGTGRWSVALAERGWEVTGVDVVPKALRAAQGRAQTAGVDVTFVEGDVTALGDTGVGGRFSLLLDVECFNHLNDSRRAAMGREVDALATPDATMLVLVWSRAHRGPLPPGATPEDLSAALPAWRIVDEQRYAGEAELPRPLRNIAPRWYRLERV